MKLPRKIRYWLSSHFLDQKPEGNRRIKVANYGSARSVGVIYKEKDEAFFILVKQFVRYLKAEHGIREIMTMAYIDDKHIPHWQLHKLEYSYFTIADCDWRLKPKSPMTDDFLAKDFDILIDFTQEVLPPLMHLLAKSRARFKVGAWNPNKKELLDFMVDLDDKNTFDQYLHKLNHFLTIINRKQNAEAV